MNRSNLSKVGIHFLLLHKKVPQTKHFKPTPIYWHTDLQVKSPGTEWVSPTLVGLAAKKLDSHSQDAPGLMDAQREGGMYKTHCV